ncbi:hypothetical protein CBL_09399 [Carabus blaptoides fortunei]
MFATCQKFILVLFLIDYLDLIKANNNNSRLKHHIEESSPVIKIPSSPVGHTNTNNHLFHGSALTSSWLQINKNLVPNKRQKKEIQSKTKVWDHWGTWSSCSVTCGAGKLTRWRHCVRGGCATGEKEAQIKTCTLPAC